MKIKTEDFVFHHTGIVTDDMGQSINFFVNLGYMASKVYKDEIQKSYVTILSKSNSPIIELISPMNNESPAQGWVKRIGSGAYHVCFEIKNLKLNEAIIYFKSQNFIIVSKPSLSPAFGGLHVVFLWGKKAGLIELIGSV